MNIIVCIKQVPDPEGARDSYVVNSDNLTVEPKGIPPVLSPFDENALEAAMRIKDEDPEGVKVTILSMGSRFSPNFVLKALAVGADEMIKIEDEMLEPGAMDSISNARCLAMAVEKVGEYELVLVGRQAADWNAGQTGILLAEVLGIPAITFARDIRIEEDTLTVRKAHSSGYSIENTSLPALVMVNNDYGAMRYPSINKMHEARKKPVIAWDAGDLGIKEPFETRMTLVGLEPPELEERDCLMIESDSQAEAGRKLAQKLVEDKVI